MVMTHKFSLIFPRLSRPLLCPEQKQKSLGTTAVAKYDMILNINFKGIDNKNSAL